MVYEGQRRVAAVWRGVKQASSILTGKLDPNFDLTGILSNPRDA